MGVLKGTTDVKTFTIGQQGSVLTLVPTSQIVGLPVANIPAQTFIEYNATLADGRALLVVVALSMTGPIRISVSSSAPRTK